MAQEERCKHCQGTGTALSKDQVKKFMSERLQRAAEVVFRETLNLLKTSEKSGLKKQRSGRPYEI